MSLSAQRGGAMDKAGYRKESLERVGRLAKDDRSVKDSALCIGLRGFLEGLGGIRYVAGFMPIGSEPGIRPILEGITDGIDLLLPRYASLSSSYELVRIDDLGRDMRPGRYGILEPIAERIGFRREDLDFSGLFVWLVPGLGFDRFGHRLGRGGGYYDRLLGFHRGVRVGVCYDCQLFASLPHESHDLPVDWVVTETRILKCQ
ncbi:MAG: 5-formyltetrahydrofolate cyclo-ligase [Lentisphaerae bacterium]|jgi:5-formyltetrahydrofolate cyclo-ligase|nr:5-formyltetrahydrofolate cyclo-ligase [Lentisphaerota bacterium]